MKTLYIKNSLLKKNTFTKCPVWKTQNYNQLWNDKNRVNQNCDVKNNENGVFLIAPLVNTLFSNGSFRLSCCFYAWCHFLLIWYHLTNKSKYFVKNFHFISSVRLYSTSFPNKTFQNFRFAFNFELDMSDQTILIR